MAQVYDEKWMPTGIPREVNERESVFENLNAQNKLILDAGAGTLRFSIESVNRGARQVVAIDLELDLLKRGIEKAEFSDIKNKTDVLRADVRYLPFIDSVFDYVISIEVYQHIPKNRKLFLEETYRVLKNPGCAFINGFNAIPRIVAGYFGFAERGTEVWKSRRRSYYWENYFRYFFPWEFKSFMLASPFNEVKILGVHSTFFLPQTEMKTREELLKASRLLRTLFFLQITIDKLFRKINWLNQITGRQLLAMLRK